MFFYMFKLRIRFLLQTYDINNYNQHYNDEM